MSAATGCIIYAYLKFSIMGQQLVCSGRPATMNGHILRISWKISVTRV